jgi:hypothetical protein
VFLLACGDLQPMEHDRSGKHWNRDKGNMGQCSNQEPLCHKWTSGRSGQPGYNLKHLSANTKPSAGDFSLRSLALFLLIDYCLSRGESVST